MTSVRAIILSCRTKGLFAESLRVVGMGHTAGYAALLAAAIDDRIGECVADLNHSDFARGTRNPMWPIVMT